MSISLDPFGFSVNDLRTETNLLRYNSTGDLYPLFSSSQVNSSATQSALTVLSSDVWHNRLGHPGDAILKSLCNQKLIECNKACQIFCSSCSLGKHHKLPFYDSLSYTFLPFDIIHSDVWTFSIVSHSGHCYYVLFLDDYNKFFMDLSYY